MPALKICVSNLTQYYDVLCWNGRRSDDSDVEIDDSTVNHILLVTQTPPAFRKHPGGDRTGDFQPRAKMTAELARQIDDGLRDYEQELFEEEERIHRMVGDVMHHHYNLFICVSPNAC